MEHHVRERMRTVRTAPPRALTSIEEGLTVSVVYFWSREQLGTPAEGVGCRGPHVDNSSKFKPQGSPLARGQTYPMYPLVAADKFG
jgi:hypothetical protein